jgi:glycolate oxidase
MDGTIPRKRLGEMLRTIQALEGKYQLRCPNVFHAGDGNLHPLILFDSRKQDQVDKIFKLSEDIMKICVAVGGSLSGEHGIGMEKNDFMGLVFNDDDLDTMMQVKRVFNPTGRLNPSKVFPSQKSCSEIGKHNTTSTEVIGKRVEAVLLRGSGDR